MTARRLSTARKEQICMCYVLVTRGRLPTDLGVLLAAMRERIGDVSEDEVRKAIKWALRQPRGPRARRVVRLAAYRPQFPA
jgi:hypothetical protein